MKVKVGTQLEEEVYQQIKMKAAEERKPVGELLQDAILDYLQHKRRRASPRTGLQRFLERDPFNLTAEQFRETMEVDFYDQ